MKKSVFHFYGFKNTLTLFLFFGMLLYGSSCDQKPVDLLPNCPSPQSHNPSWTQSKFNIQAGESITFTYTGIDPIGSDFSVEWDFPGGTPDYSNETNPTITYSLSGSYKVTCKMRCICASNEQKRTTIDPAVTVLP